MKIKKYGTALLLVTLSFAVNANQYSNNQGVNRDESTVQQAESYVSDASITAAIKGRLLKESEVSGLRIHVKTDHGVVTLYGNVDNRTQSKLAQSIANSSNGVKNVKNNLRIRNVN